MGNAGSVDALQGSAAPEPRVLHGQPPPRLPMPSEEELEMRFAAVLNSMNLPPDKAQLLQDYDVEKKWELVCDQERFQVKNPPHTYIQQLKSHMEFSMARKFKRRVQESTQVLREIEISLRTNHIGWVREFLNEENRGLDVLVDYLCHTQSSGTYDDAAAATTDSGATPSMAERQKSLDGAVDEDAEHESSGGGLTSAASSVSRAAKQLLLRYCGHPAERPRER